MGAPRLAAQQDLFGKQNSVGKKNARNGPATMFDCFGFLFGCLLLSKHTSVGALLVSKTFAEKRLCIVFFGSAAGTAGNHYSDSNQ